MISSLNLALFPSNELLTFTKHSIVVAETKKTQLSVIVPFLSNVSTKNTAFQSALERESKNPLIAVQSDRDKDRIDAFMAFRNYCNSSSTRRKEGIPAAAESLIAVIRRHAWRIQSIGQKARTAIITNIISEIQTKYAAELTLIGGGELLDELAQAQLSYETAAHNAIQLASESNEPTVAETRPELTAAIKALFQIISLQEISAPSADVTALIAAMNELIVTSLSTVKASDTRVENAKKKTDESKANEAVK